MKKKKSLLFIVFIFFLTLNSVNAQDKYGKVAISEVYFDSYVVEESGYANHHAGEFIELYNSSTESIDISGWKIEDNVTSFTIPNNTIIASGGFKVITFTATKSLFIQLFPEAAGHEQDIILQSNFILNNNIEKIHLLDLDNNLISDASYIPIGWLGSSFLENDLENLLELYNFAPVYGFSYLDNHENLSHSGAIPSFAKTGIRLSSPEPFYKHIVKPYLYLHLFENGEARPFELHLNVPLLSLESSFQTYSPYQPDQLQEDLHWVNSNSYNIKGELLSSGVSYFDDLGKGMQSHSLDIKTGKIWVNETRYDASGRSAFNTLSSPIGTDWGYKSDFIKKINGNTFADSDLLNIIDNNAPELIGKQENTLGYYYSDANFGNKYQDVTEHPYSRSIYSKLNPGKTLKSLGGSKIEGEWKQGYSFSMPAAQEMYYVFGYNSFDRLPDVVETYSNVGVGILNDSNKLINWLKVNKTVVEDVHGNQSVIFVDDDDKTLASAKAGGAKKYDIISLIGEQKYIDIHLPKGCDGDIFFYGSIADYRVFNLKTEQVVTNPINLPSGFYRIEYIGSSALNKSSSLTYINKTSNSISPVSSTYAGVKYRVNYYDFSLNYYNKVGDLIASLQPLGFNDACLNSLSATVGHNLNLVSEFSTNSLGHLTYTKSPDEGEANFKYRKDGQIRFSQNSKQIIVSEFSYTNYDNLSRPVESGVSTGTFNSLNADSSVIIVGKEQVFTEYDFLNSPSSLTSLTGLSLDYHNPSFLAGNISRTRNTDENGNLISQSFYSYDVYGRVKWEVQNTPSLGTKTIDYEYDPVTSQVLKVLYQKNMPSERFIHRYKYNISQELVSVETSTDAINYIKHAEYSYNENGSLKRTTLAGGLQGIDYVYNLAGQLKAINHPSLTASLDPGGDSNDLFGMVIDYYSGDYNRNGDFSFVTSGTNQYNGNIKGVTSKTPNLGGNNNAAQYSYSYNKNNWLESATFSGGNAILNNDYKVDNITYDANGNIKTLYRNKNTINGNSNLMDQFTYEYKSGASNKLDHINDAVTTNGNDGDLKDQDPNNYRYNEIGQLTDNIEDKVKYEYNTSGLVTKVLFNNYVKVQFLYNEKGFRTKKITNINNSNTIVERTTDYVRDAVGNALAIYENQVQVELPIYGANRLGIYKKINNTSIYQLTDHLGNVRAVIAKEQNGNAAALVSSTDYYPFGMAMPGRQVTGGQLYRYSFQGQEKDSETGKEAFQLRLWDGRIGRWLTTDPARQYHSPYMGMGNNPISSIDPDGGESFIERPDDYSGPMGDGDWYVSDRLNNTERWKTANSFNLSKGLEGAFEYTTITQRTAFYGWFQNEIYAMGHETQWAGAAFVIAGQMAELDTWKSAFVSDEVVEFANAGNKAIFNDVFDDLGAVYFSNTKITGAQAELWDMKTLYNEQFNVVDPIYKEQSKQTLNTLAKMAKGKGIYWFGVPNELKVKGNINSPLDRFNHGWNKATAYYLKYHFKK